MYFCEKMMGLLLYSQAEASYTLPLLWGIGILVLIVLLVFLFLQHRWSRRLKNELAELEKVKQGNVEYEFVLKAMKLCTWHIDPKMRTITIENDFREGMNNAVRPSSPVDLLTDMLVKTDAQRVQGAIDDICMGRTNFYHQKYLVKTGGYWEESFATVSERDENNKPTMIVGTSMRIDEQKKMEAALINARNKAEESDRLKTAFLANMGHEIRTPLNAIVGFADLLPVVDNEADRNQLITEIQNNNQKLLHIIDGLVSMSKVEAEAKNLIRSKIDIVPIIQEIANSYSNVVDGTSVVVATQFQYTELMMNTDIEKLTEIVDNLMQNAIKFTTKGRVTLGFDITDGEHVRIWVRDTGMGIAETDKDRIFDRFVKLNEYVPGAGLGLSVAKSHSESLGGTIGVESRLGEGSTFWVELPLN